MQQERLTAPERAIHRVVDPEFKHKLSAIHPDETLKYCYQCGSCTSNCPIARFIHGYRPNKILELAKLGIRGAPESNAFFLCSACTQCTKGCPQGVAVHETMNALKDLAANDAEALGFLTGGFEDALVELSGQIPFPVSYGWISLRPSGEETAKNPYDALCMEVLDRALKRLKDGKAPEVPALEGAPAVAVVGAGPAGLTCAWALQKGGAQVTVFEALDEPGGMLSVGIPTYRLPKELVSAEIDLIRALGVKIVTGAPVDKAQFEALLSGGTYQAVFVATGAHANRKIRIEGEDLPGVMTALDFLRRYNIDGRVPVGQNVVVIGGGNVALDVARAAVRCGAASVKLFCLESREEMPSHKWEVLEGAEEGVDLNPSWGPTRITGNENGVEAVEFVRCKSVFDASGRFSPVFDEKKTLTEPADTVVTAIGQYPVLNYLEDAVGLARGTVAADPYTFETDRPGVFAGGDAVSGTASLIEAIVAGKTAADSILRSLAR